MMTRIIVGIIAIFWLFLQPYSAINANEGSDFAIEFSGISPEYFSNESINFEIVNIGFKSIRITCAAEKIIDGRWTEVSYSLTTGSPMKATRVFILEPQGRQAIEWDAWHKAPDGPFGPGQYRLRIDALDEQLHGTPQKVYSEPFALVRD